MTIRNGKIVKTTIPELFEYYLQRGFDDIMDFNEYMMKCENLGTKIIKEKENE